MLDYRVRRGQPYSIQAGGWSPDADNANAADGDLRLEYYFFPDTDGDGLLDGEDRCPSEAGVAKFAGCPDSDGDDVVNSSDRCPTTSGRLNGCPDADGDLLADIDDRCPTEDARVRDADKNGCLDIMRLDELADAKLRFDRVPRFGIKVRALQVTGLPPGARVDFRCVRGRRSCGSGVRIADAGARSAKTIALLRRGLKLRSGTVIEIRVTAPKAIGKYVRFKVNRRRSGATRVDGCLSQGQTASRRVGTCA